MPERRRNLLAGREASIHPVLDLAAGAVDVLVKGTGVDLLGRERGHDEARVRPLGQVLGLGDHAPLPAPAVQRPPSEVGEATGRATSGQALRFGNGEFIGDRPDQALVAGEPEDVADPVALAPGHQRVPGEAGVGP
jgi:hypothetical protein